MEQRIHVEAPAQDDDAIVCVMLCGAKCRWIDDEIVPDGFDFYRFQDAEKATCEACKNEAARVLALAFNKTLNSIAVDA
jgi:hypothetical protein